MLGTTCIQQQWQWQHVHSLVSSDLDHQLLQSLKVTSVHVSMAVFVKKPPVEIT